MRRKRDITPGEATRAAVLLRALLELPRVRRALRKDIVLQLCAMDGDERGGTAEASLILDAKTGRILLKVAKAVAEGELVRLGVRPP